MLEDLKTFHGLVLDRCGAVGATLLIPIFALATDAYVWELLITRLLLAMRLNMYLPSDVCFMENLPRTITIKIEM